MLIRCYTFAGSITHRHSRRGNHIAMRIDITPCEDVPQSLQDDIYRRGGEIDWGNPDGVTEWSRGEWQVVVWEGETWVSTLVLHKKIVTVGGESVTVGGVGGVMTLPEWQG